MKKFLYYSLLLGVCLLWANSVVCETRILGELGDGSFGDPVSSLGDTVVTRVSGALGGDWGDDIARPDTENVEYVYVIEGKSWVPAESLLTIHGGVTIQLEWSEIVDIYGGFQANGTAQNPIYVRALSNAQGFHFSGASDDTVRLSHVRFSSHPDSIAQNALRSYGRVIKISDSQICAQSEAVYCEYASAIVTRCEIEKTGAGGAAIHLEHATGSLVEATGVKVKFSTQFPGLYTDGVRVHETPDLRIERSRVEIEGEGFVTGVYCEFDCSFLTVSETSIYAKSENNAPPRGVWLASAGYCDVLSCSLHVESDNTHQATVYLSGQTSARIHNSYLYLGGAGDGQFLCTDGTADTSVHDCLMVQAIRRVPSRNERSTASIIHMGKPFPNPFNSAVSVPLELGYPSDIEVIVFDALGRQVNHSSRGILSEGRHLLLLSGDSWASGVYFVQVVVDKKSLAPARIVLVK